MVNVTVFMLNDGVLTQNVYYYCRCRAYYRCSLLPAAATAAAVDNDDDWHNNHISWTVLLYSAHMPDIADSDNIAAQSNYIRVGRVLE